jgi:hypothetical protein
MIFLNPIFYCKNSAEFVAQVKTLTLNPGERMISFDAEALFPSVPIKDCIEMIGGILEADLTLTSRTKLSPRDMCNLLNLCLSSSDFIYNERHHANWPQSHGLYCPAVDDTFHEEGH